MNHRSLKLFFSALLMIPALASGLPEDRQQPIQLEADRAQLDQNTGVSTYEGNVLITQGSMRLSGDKVIIYVKDGEFERMEAFGDPVKFRYKPAADKEEINGSGQQAAYDVKSGTIVVNTNATFTQGGDKFIGDRVEYDLNQDLVKARGGGNGGRVRFTIQPKNDQQKTEKRKE